MDAQCERCGVPVEPIASATHAFCDRCASVASTGARSSSSLLFMVRRHRDRTSLVTLDELRERASARPDERVSLPLLSLTGAPRLTIPRVARRRALWPMLSVAVAGILLVGSGALAWKASERSVTGVTASRSDKAVGPMHAPLDTALEPTLETIDPPSVETEPSEPAPTDRIAEPAPSEPASTERTAAPAPRRARIVPSVRVAPTATPTPTPRDANASADDGALDLDALAGPRPASPAPRDPSLATLPAQAAVARAFGSVRSRVEACSEPSLAGTVVVARVSFRGDTGEATYAEVTGATVSPEVRSCIATAARDVEVPRFAQDRFVVTYPFRL